jgi:hypothetical protein
MYRQDASETTVCAKVEKFGGIPYPPEVTNFTPSLPLDRRGQGSQSTEFENRCVVSMRYTVEVVTALRCAFNHSALDRQQAKHRRYLPSAVVAWGG